MEKFKFAFRFSHRVISGIKYRFLDMLLKFIINCIFYLAKVVRPITVVEKSVCFLGDNYHAFFALSRSLRKRAFYSESIKIYPEYRLATLYDYDLSKYSVFKLISKYSVFKLIYTYTKIVFFYRMVHYYPHVEVDLDYGLGKFFSASHLKKLGILIGCTGSGCCDGAHQHEIMAASPGLCDRCIWSTKPDVCGYSKNQKKIDEIKRSCDFLSCDIELPSSLRRSEIAVPVPLTFPVNKFILESNQNIPPKYRISRKKGHVIILTAFGNEDSRIDAKHDIKGKGVMVKTIKNLIENGYKIQHVHISDVPSQDVKYYIMQADLVLDQLHYGSLGDFGRNSLFFGKIVFTHVAEILLAENEAMKSCPVINVSHLNLGEKIKEVLAWSHEEKHQVMNRSKEWIDKWFDTDACARRYDTIYSRLCQKKELFLKEEEVSLYE